MAGKLSYTFTLGASLASSFKGAMTGARSQVVGLAKDVRTMEGSSTGKLGEAFSKSSVKLAGLGAELKTARTQLATLKNQADSAGGASGLLARQIAQAESRVSKLTSSVKAATTSHRNLAATITNEAGSVGKLMNEYRGLTAQMEKARAKQRALSANLAARSANKARRGELRGGLLDAIALGSSVALPAKFAIDFEDSIARVGALANTGAKGMAALTAQARQLGRDTRFTAVQAAEGMQFLAMAGFNVEDTMSAMPGMLDLAAAGALDLGRAADIASNILSAFKIPAKNMVRVSDALAYTFTTSNTTMESLGESMKYVGPVASAVNMSLEDTAATVGLLGNVGLQGAQAGTALRAALLRLAAPAKMGTDALKSLAAGEGMEMSDLLESMDEAQKALKKIGVVTKDAKGNLRPMVDVLEEMNLKMANLGSGQKMEVIKKVFGMNAAAAMAELMNQAGKTVDDYGNKIVDAHGKQTTALRKYMTQVNASAGTGKRIAKQMNDTTKGALLEMRSALEDNAIVIGNLFTPAIRGAAGVLRSGATATSAFIEKYPTFSKVVGTAAAATVTLAVASKGLAYGYTFVKGGLLLAEAGLLRLTGAQVANTAVTGKSILLQKAWTGAMALSTTAIRGVVTGVRVMSLAMMANPIGLVLGGIALAATAIIANWEKVGPVFIGVANNIVRPFSWAWNAIIDGAKWAFAWLEQKFAWFTDTIHSVKGAWNSLTGGRSKDNQPVTSQPRPVAMPSAPSTFPGGAAPGYTPSSSTFALYTPPVSAAQPSSGSSKAAAASVSVPMQFNFSGVDDETVRRRLEAYRPEFERLAKRAVADAQHDKERVSHGD